MKKKNFNVEKAKNMPFPFSLAIEAGNHVYLSAQPAMSLDDGRLIDGDFKAQYHQCMANLDDVLKAANLDRSNVIKCTVFLVDMQYYPEMNELFAKSFEKPYPTRTCVAVKELPLKALVEIEMVAYRDAD